MKPAHVISVFKHWLNPFVDPTQRRAFQDSGQTFETLPVPWPQAQLLDEEDPDVL